MAQIVLIDSESTVRSVVSKILEGAGHSVRATGEFREAIQMLHNFSADLVVTNVYLHGITGHEAMHCLKEEFPGTRILMMSGLPDEKSIAEWAGDSRFDIFPKPFLPDSLVQKVEQMLVTSKNK